MGSLSWTRMSLPRKRVVYIVGEGDFINVQSL